MIANSEVAAARGEDEATIEHPIEHRLGEEGQQNLEEDESSGLSGGVSPTSPAWLPRRQRNMDLTEDQKSAAKTDFYTLLSIQAFVCFLSNGALPSIQVWSLTNSVLLLLKKKSSSFPAPPLRVALNKSLVRPSSDTYLSFVQRMKVFSRGLGLLTDLDFTSYVSRFWQPTSI